MLRNLQAMENYVTVTELSSMTGLPAKEIVYKIKYGHWIDGKEYEVADDGLLISIDGFERWIEAGSLRQPEPPPQPKIEAPRRTALYRHYDAEDQLLYVGISWSFLARQAAHFAGSDWFDQVASIKVEWFPTRQDADRAETVAIQQENPLFNIAKRLTQ